MTQVVAALIQRAGRILVCQRRTIDPHPLKWEFPGGKVEPGETPAEALARELEEELGLHAQIGEEVTRYSFAYPGKAPILLIFFKVTRFANEPENRIFTSMVWEAPERLPEYDFLAGDVDFLRTLARRDG